MSSVNCGFGRVIPPGLLAASLCWLAWSSLSAAPVVEFVTVGAGSDLALNAKFVRPEGVGGFPAVVVLHGSGGLWKDNNPTNGVMSKHFEEYAIELANAGIACLFVDSFTPRGLVEFASRRPAQDPNEDDSKCSPAYGRPHDAYKALAFLQARSDIRRDRIGLMGFSHGAETTLASLLSSTVTKTNWTMSYLLTNGTTITTNFPAPVRLASGATGFRVAVAYYPGCGYYGYFGSPSSTNANLYMPYVPTLILHGSADPLYAANLYPERFVGKSFSQAQATGLTYNPAKLVVYANANHSFDEANIETVPPVETPDQIAKRESRALVMMWFEVFLKDLRLTTRPALGGLSVNWSPISGVTYRVQRSATLNFWSTVTTLKSSQTGGELGYGLGINAAELRQFVRVESWLLEPF